MDRTLAEAAAEYRLHGADAIYVAVAHVLGIAVATLDREIQQRVAQIVDVIVP